MYTTQVKTAALPVERWLRDYRTPERFRDACSACPDYGRVWSCPPGVPEAERLFAPFSTVSVIGVSVIYSQRTRAAADTPEHTELIRQSTYGQVKKALMASLLELERELPGSWSVAAGRCEQCRRCTRRDGLPCRRPERLRFSFSAFGFDLGRMAEELLGLRLLWAARGLPEYTVALAAFLHPGDARPGLSCAVRPQRPWPVLREEALGLLRRMGFHVEQGQPAGGRRRDRAVDLDGRSYELVFDEPVRETPRFRLRLSCVTGSPVRMEQMAGALGSALPELAPLCVPER